jgi:hypothetical protein
MSEAWLELCAVSHNMAETATLWLNAHTASYGAAALFGECFDTMSPGLDIRKMLEDENNRHIAALLFLRWAKPTAPRGGPAF